MFEWTAYCDNHNYYDDRIHLKVILVQYSPTQRTLPTNDIGRHMQRKPLRIMIPIIWGLVVYVGTRFNLNTVFPYIYYFNYGGLFCKSKPPVTV